VCWMINKKDLASIRRELEAYTKKREAVIQISRGVLRLSKQAIACTHRKDLKMAAQHLKEAEKDIKKAKKQIGFDPRLSIMGAYSVAMQEYVEAKTFLHFVKHRKLLPFSSLDVDPEDYLMGLADLTGELSRKAVLQTIARKYDDVSFVREFVVGIHDFFLTLNLRNGELRKKNDAIKWNLKRIEDILYDVRMKK
jgi:predicted translin family RNA/ssDNA-binding protein